MCVPSPSLPSFGRLRPLKVLLLPLPVNPNPCERRVSSSFSSSFGCDPAREFGKGFARVPVDSRWVVPRAAAGARDEASLRREEEQGAPSEYPGCLRTGIFLLHIFFLKLVALFSDGERS